MAPLKIFACVMAIAIPTQVMAETVADWRPYVTEASLRFGIPTVWIERVLFAESRGRTTLNGRPIRSSAGAMGLMQLMPATWDAMRRRLALGAGPDDPRDNILAGTFFLRLMYDRFGYPGLFAAYNVGPERYAKHLATGSVLPTETIAYLHAVAGDTPVVVGAGFQPPREALFAVRRDAQAPMADDPQQSPPTLFAVRRDGR